MIRDEAAAEAARDRLERVRYAPDARRLDSSILLVKEYLRRSALWAVALDCADGGLFFDIAQRLAQRTGDDRPLPGYALLDPEPDYRGPGADPLEDRVLALRPHLRGPGRAVTTLMERCLLWSVRWAAVAADPAASLLGPPAPYEPLVVLYERGGWFQMHHGEIEFFPSGGLRVGDAARRAAPEPIVSLDPAALDRMDKGTSQ